MQCRKNSVFAAPGSLTATTPVDVIRLMILQVALAEYATPTPWFTSCCTITVDNGSSHGHDRHPARWSRSASDFGDYSWSRRQPMNAKAASPTAMTIIVTAHL